MAAAFLFDLDGTLLDFEGASHRALNTALRPHSASFRDDEPVSWALQARVVGTPEENWTRVILHEVGLADHVSPRAFANSYHESVAEAYETTPLMPGALELVRGLRARFPSTKLAIATSSVRRNFDRKMAFHSELLALFDAVVTGAEVPAGRGKPAPDIFIEAARRLGADPRKCVVFEDAPSGVRAGKAAGALVVAVPDWHFAAVNGDKFHEADLVVPDFVGFLDRYVEALKKWMSEEGRAEGSE